MKQLKSSTIIFILISLGYTSCTIREEGGTDTKTTLFNHSSHNIELQQFSSGEYRGSVFIDNSKSEEIYFSGDMGQKGSVIQLTFGDSIQIIYGELASIWHTKADTQIVSKSLLLESSYTGGKVKDGLYEFTYTFTEDDFQEAVDFGD